MQRMHGLLEHPGPCPTLSALSSGASRSASRGPGPVHGASTACADVSSFLSCSLRGHGPPSVTYLAATPAEQDTLDRSSAAEMQSALTGALSRAIAEWSGDPEPVGAHERVRAAVADLVLLVHRRAEAQPPDAGADAAAAGG